MLASRTPAVRPSAPTAQHAGRAAVAPAAVWVRPAAAGRRGCAVFAASRVVLAPTEGKKSKLVRTELLNKDVAVVGSGKAADVRIEDASVAEEHCKFEWRGGRLFITDLGSGKGTSFDDNNIMSGVAYIVGNNAVICLGQSESATFTVQFDAPGAPAPNSMDAMLAQAFQQNFASSKNKDVLDALESLKDSK